MAPSATAVSTASHKQKAPYLHRNWISTVGGNVHQRDHEDDDHRPPKRRRMSKNSPDSGIGLEALDAASRPTEPEKAMRMELLKIVHKDSARVRINHFNFPAPLQTNEAFDARARCRISISGGGVDGADHHLVVDSQICSIKTYKNPGGPSRMVRIHLPQPFHVSQDKILVPRDDDDVFALAERYTAHIQFESAGDPNWPPTFLDSANNANSHGDQEITPRRQWILHATIDDLFSCARKTVSLDLAKRPGVLLPTNYVLDVDVRWSTGLSANKIKRLDKDIRASITCFGEDDLMDVDHPAGTNGVSGVNGHADDASFINGHHHTNGESELANGELMDDDEMAEGDLTPGRRRRARPQINYNLKLLSDKAQKRERRKQQKQTPRNGAAESAEDAGITYLFPERLHLDGCCCIFCGTDMQSFDLLQAHCKLNHDDFDFQFGSTPPRTVTVTPLHERPGTPPLSPKALQLGPPVNGPLDLPAYLEGDETWVRSRQGPQNGRELGRVQTVAKRSAVPDADKLPNRNPRGKPKKIVVPKTKTTLYHPLSKAPLEPGTVIDRWKVDEDWLIRKHSDTLADYTDVDGNELEFMVEWDRYFLPLHLSSELYLPEHYLAFVREKADWLISRPQRPIEFSKHVAMLHARGVIDDVHIAKALAILDEARERRKAREDAGEIEPVEEEAVQAESPIRKSEGAGCAKCGGFVLPGPTWLFCQGPDCPKPLWHDYCASKENEWPTEDKDDWRCDHCAAHDDRPFVVELRKPGGGPST